VTGSQATVVPSRKVEGHRLVPSDKIPMAANGTEIGVSGETTLQMVIGEKELATECLVTEIMFGLDWLKGNECIWNFGQRTSVFTSFQ